MTDILVMGRINSIREYMKVTKVPPALYPISLARTLRKEALEAHRSLAKEEGWYEKSNEAKFMADLIERIDRRKM